MFMRTTQFAPQVTYSDELLGASWRNLPRHTRRLNSGQAKMQFQEWLRRRFPTVADKIRGQGLGDVATPAATEKWYESIGKALPGAATAYAQYKLVKVNLDRAKQGLPPIDSAAYAPTVKVQADVDPATRQSINIATIAIGGIAALGALKLLKVI